MDRIPKRRKFSQAILQSLGAGVVPRTGVEYIAVGRKAEMVALEQDLDIINDGGASFRLIVGRYGSGKSFLLQLLRNFALKQKFVVADADISPQRRLTGSKGEGLALYRELLNNMATRSRPNGNAFAPLMEKWLSDIQSKIARSGLEPSSREFERKVSGQVHQVMGEMETMTHGYDFAEVLNAYWCGHRDNDEGRKSAAMRWLRGEFSTKTEARQALRGDVRVMIDDGSWYEYVKLLAYFVRQIGYRGLIIFMDEAVYLSRISNTTARRNNYERLLSILNDTLQGNAEYLGVLLGATPPMVEDPRRGLFSYEALETRLQESRYGRPGLRDLSGPMVRLDVLKNEEIYLLLQTIRDIHAWHYKYESLLGDLELRAFMSEVQGRVGTETLLTPRNVLRDFVSLLNLLNQYPAESFESLLGQVDFKTGVDSQDDADSPYASFQI